MARIKDSSVETVKQVADILPLVEARTRLRKVGARYVGLCPFHQEKTPSFSVSPDRGTYHCFGCGAGGDAISFVRETEGLDFVGAIEWLADRFHVPLEYEDASPDADARRRRRERLLALLEQAAAFYERALWESTRGAAAREYLESRGLGEGVCREFRLGFSPAGSMLVAKAADKGFTRPELAEAGLLSRRGTDYFQGRLMFPLADGRGRIVGFQARKLREDDPLRGKYVNSPESELFHKSAVLYGLHLARAAVSKQDRAIVVEGNTDVIALRQAELEPVVASMGTALTERQLKELARLTRRVFLCFDADAAGEDATLRGMELALREGFDVRVVALPRGQDPADDPVGFESRLGGAESYAVHRIRLEIARARDKSVAYLRGQEFLNGIPDSPERLEAWRLLNDRLGMTVQLQSAVSATTSLGTAVSPKLLEMGERLERSALAGVRAHPDLARVLGELGPQHFDSERHQRAAVALAAGREDEELTQFFAELDAIAAAEAIDEPTAEQLLLKLRERRLQTELAEAGDDRLVDLQQALARVRERIREFA
jgi:DNA primase catalytic core